MADAILLEIWKSIPKYEDIYEISNFGNIRRIKKSTGTSVGKLLKPWVSSNGYCMVGLSNKCKVKTFTVHRLVYKTFVNDPLDLDVCHNNGNRTDNKLSNLRADTRKGNMSDIYKHDTHIRGERCGTSKYTENFILEFRENVKNFTSIRNAALFYKIPYQTAYGIVKRKTWGWL